MFCCLCVKSDVTYEEETVSNEAINEEIFVSAKNVNSNHFLILNDDKEVGFYAEKYLHYLSTDYDHFKTDCKSVYTMSDLSAIVTRLEMAVSKLEGLTILGDSGGGAGQALNQAAVEETHPVVIAYKEIVNGPLAQFLHISRQIGGEVQEQAAMVVTAFNVQASIVSLAPRCKAPDQSEQVNLLKPLSDGVQAIQNYREKNRPSKFINHLSTISESIPALFWVTVTPTPGPYVKEMIDAGQFYSNRVLMEYKDKEKTHVDWVKSWIQVLTELQQYIKQHHTTGLSWNPRGGSVSASNIQKPATGGKIPPPPPGPPPPPPSLAELNAFAQPVSDDRAALFQQINQGEDVSKGLRKVTPEMMTHKNPNLRLQSATPYKPPQLGPRPFRVAGGGAGEELGGGGKTPKFELQGKKWVIEHHNDNQNLVVSEAQMNQAVYIFACNNCLIQVKGKVNSITVDNCKKTSLTFENIVSSVEFINCQRIKTQALGKVPTLSIDKTDGIEVYLGSDSLEVEIVSSKSSEMNVLVPKGDGDFAEFPVPEQFKTKWNGKGLSTQIVEQA